MPFGANEAQPDGKPRRQAHGHSQMREAGNGRQLACAWSRKCIALAQSRYPRRAICLGNDYIDFAIGKHLVERIRSQPARRFQSAQLGRVVQPFFLVRCFKGVLSEILQFLVGIGLVEGDDIGKCFVRHEAIGQTLQIRGKIGL